jgi:general secretion pathway protein H
MSAERATVTPSAFCVVRSVLCALPARARPARGFTLVEILVVIVIIGIVASMATLAIGVLGRDREVEEQTRRFWAVLQQAREEADLQSLDIGVFVSDNAYEYLRFDQRQGAWQPIYDDKLYERRELPEGLRFRLWLEGREIVMKSGEVDRSDKDEDKKYPPQIAVLSSGEIAPFELRIERDATDALWRVVGLADNDLHAEERKDNQWIVVLRTKPEKKENERGKRK